MTVESKERKPFLMGRILSVPLAMESIVFPAEMRLELIFDISDPCLPQNQSPFHCQIHGGRCRCQRLAGDKVENEIAVISLDISQLSQLVFGIESAATVLGMTSPSTGSKRIDEQTIRLLDQLFPVCRNFISEYF